MNRDDNPAVVRIERLHLKKQKEENESRYVVEGEARPKMNQKLKVAL